MYQLLMSCRESDFSTILDGVHGAKITSWWDRAVDIIPATGERKYCKGVEVLWVRPIQALAFGDGNNDVEMFQAVGTGVAMENASEKTESSCHRPLRTCGGRWNLLLLCGTWVDIRFDIE